jgi:hypothetical protein
LSIRTEKTTGKFKTTSVSYDQDIERQKACATLKLVRYVPFQLDSMASVNSTKSNNVWDVEEALDDSLGAGFLFDFEEG